MMITLDDAREYAVRTISDADVRTGTRELDARFGVAARVKRGDVVMRNAVGMPMPKAGYVRRADLEGAVVKLQAWVADTLKVSGR